MKPKARVANALELPTLVELSRQQVATSPIASIGGFCTKSAFNTFAAAIERPDAIVITSGTGYLIGVVSPLPFNSKVYIAQEIGWFEKEKGGRVMLEAFEAWAKEMRVALVAMARIEGYRDKALDVAYRRYGYRMAEHHYIKEI